MRILMVALLLFQTGCAGLAFNARERIPCYIGRAQAESFETAYPTCTMQTMFQRQMEACMTLKGYDVGECYADTRNPVVFK